MKKITFATVVSSAVVALAVGLAGPAVADAGSGSNVPAPAPVYPWTTTGGARLSASRPRTRPGPRSVPGPASAARRPAEPRRPAAGWRA